MPQVGFAAVRRLLLGMPLQLCAGTAQNAIAGGGVRVMSGRRMLMALAALTLIGAGASSWAEELPEVFFVWAVQNKSDDNLNAARIVCAFGDMRETIREAAAEGAQTPNIPDYCQAVVREAVKRKNEFHLYSRMQPGKAAEEWQLILSASLQDAKRYVNAEGVEKMLPCELAFDAGYVYGSAHPQEPVMPEFSEAKIDALAVSCFTSASSSSLLAVVAGTRIAQRNMRP